MQTLKTLSLVVLVLLVSLSTLKAQTQKADTLKTQTKLITLEKKGAYVYSLKEAGSGIMIRIDDSPIKALPDDFLLLVDGKKTKSLKEFNPRLIESYQILTRDDVPKKYRKKGIVAVIKVKTIQPSSEKKKHN